MAPDRPSPLRRALGWTPSRKLLRRLAWALLALLAIRAALPFAIERVAESVGTDVLGRRVEIADVDLALLAGGVIVEQVAVGPLGRRGEEPPEFSAGEEHFTLKRLTGDLGWRGLLGGEVHVESVDLVEPNWLMLRDASGELVPVLLPREEEAEESTSEEEAGPGPGVRVDVLTVTGLDARFVNLARPDELPLRFELAQLRVEGVERRGQQITLRDVGLRAPTLRVLRDIDLSFLAEGEPLAEDAAAATELAVAAEEAAPVALPDVRLARLDIETARFLLITQEGEVATSLAFHAEDLTLERDATFPLRATLGIEDGEIVVEGNAGAFPPVFSGTLAWKALPLATLGGAAGSLSPFLLESGISSGELTIDARMAGDAPSRLGVRGRVGVETLALRDRDGALALGWQRLDVGLEELDLDPGGERPPRVSLSQVALESPRVRVVRQVAAASEVAPGDASETTGEAAPGDASETTGEAAPQPELSVARLDLEDGELEFVDETLTPVHTSRVVDLQVKGEALRWPAQQADSLTVSFGGPDAARFALDASVSGGASRAHLELDDLGLPAFSAYAAEASGYWVEQGVLSVEADVDVHDGRTEIDSDLELVQLDVSEVRPGSFEKEFGVPIGLGIALLQDPSGRIGLPIKASLGGEGGRVSLAAILVSALRQAILGALTAPLKTAGLLLGGDDDSGGLRLEPIEMAAGSVEPSEQDLEALARFAGVLEARPGLALELRGATAPEDDRVLAETILEEQVVADAKLPAVEAGFLQRRRLRGALRERAEGGAGELDAEDREVLERWIAAIEVPDERREALARQRAEAVRDALLSRHGLDAERVQLGDPTEGAPGVVVGLAPVKR